MAYEEMNPFLEGNDDDATEKPHESQPCGKQRHLLTVSLLMNILLLVVCAMLSTAIVRLATVSPNINHDKFHTDGEMEDPYSPANEVIEYEYRSMVANDTRFTGYPTKRWERSMHELMNGTLLRITDEELALQEYDSIPLKGGGYAGGLGVGHNLHCVKQIKKFLYREYFYPGLERNQEEFNYTQAHADHCLDFIRQSIMCHLDYSLYTVYWGERYEDIPRHNLPGVMKCVNWNRLHEWMMARSTSMDMLLREREMSGSGIHLT
ncbi:hypothetical protein PG990_000142 [Apiospora arundinis]